MVNTSTPNGALLTAPAVRVQTAQVEISMVRVGKKHVTQAMFRQLPFKAITLSPTPLFRGDPWGHVNYWWGGDERRYISGARLHLVWQEQGRLYRDIVYQHPLGQALGEYTRRVEQAAEDYWLATHPGVCIVSGSGDAIRPWQDAPTMHTVERTWVANRLATPESTALYAAWREAVDDQQDYVALWAEQRECLTRLPQLFIAV
jgi:hypothetical protein